MVAADLHAAGPAGSLTVSVIIPCYHAAGFVTEAVGSALAQGVPGVEVIVINDGSPDEEELRSALQPVEGRIVYLDEPHRGLPATRNSGIAVARGEFLAFLDADDAWKPGFLECQLEVLRDTGADLVYCDAEVFGETPHAGATVMDLYPSVGEVTVGSVLTGECVPILSTVVVRTERVREVGSFDPSLSFCEDLDLWVRLLDAGSRFTYHRAPLARRREHGANMSNNFAGMLRGVLDTIDRHLGTHDRPPDDRRRVEKRARRLRGELHLEQAKQALQNHNLGEVRGELWSAFRWSKKPKLVVAALAFSLAPGLALRLLHGRFKPEGGGT